MSAQTLSSSPDEVASLIADFTVHAPAQLDARTARAAKAVLIDSLAVSMGALTHPAAQAARRHVYRFATPDGCAIWGSQKRATPELAALTNGVLLRCYDYNDFFVGQRNSGHPSDMVAGVIAAAEWAAADRSPRSRSATRWWRPRSTPSRPRRAAGTTPTWWRSAALARSRACSASMPSRRARRSP